MTSYGSNVSNSINNLNLRKINLSDEELLLEWRNDEDTRKNSKCQDAISKEDHQKWIKKTISDHPNTSPLILEDKNVPVGTIRSDETVGGEHELSWTISPKCRRKGYGSKILKLFLLNKIGTFIAKIKPSNIASIKVAEKNGFKLVYNNNNNNLSTYKKTTKRTDLEIIDEIEKVRAKNNVNWMDILRLAFTHAPEDARKLMTKVNEHDGRVSELLKELSNNE
jgi:RimJ/RimL family protein N-acetyltransferase